jgi:hypothetical protein
MRAPSERTVGPGDTVLHGDSCERLVDLVEMMATQISGSGKNAEAQRREVVY